MEDRPNTLIQYLRLPDTIRTGEFDERGNVAEDEVSLYITVRDTSFLWGVFRYRLNEGQLGEIIFTNVPGTFLVGVSFTEWDEESHEPCIRDTEFTLLSAQRGDGIVRIVGRHNASRPVAAAAGIVVADDASYLQEATRRSPPR